MAYKNIYLKRGKNESLKRFHPWVFSGAIQRTDAEEGEVVNIILLKANLWPLGIIRLVQ